MGILGSVNRFTEKIFPQKLEIFIYSERGIKQTPKKNLALSWQENCFFSVQKSVTD
jgi:hypothetical protein